MLLHISHTGINSKTTLSKPLSDSGLVLGRAPAPYVACDGNEVSNLLIAHKRAISLYLPDYQALRGPRHCEVVGVKRNSVRYCTYKVD